jgi:TonB family protein
MTGRKITVWFVAIAGSLIWMAISIVSGYPIGALVTIPQNPSAQAQQLEPLPIDSKVMEARLVKKADPVYSELAIRVRVEGVVRLSVVVNEQGEVARALIIGGGHPLLQPAALEAVKQWRYAPYLGPDGHAVPVITIVYVTFRLPPVAPVLVAPAQVTNMVVNRLPQEPLKVSGKIQASKLLTRVDPAYPESAQRAHIQGVVDLEVLINEQGEVTRVRVLQGHPLLEQAAMDAVKQWSYAPTYFNGDAVQVLTIASVPFGVVKSTFRLIVGPEGTLHDLLGLPAPIDVLREFGNVVVSADRETPFVILEWALKDLQEQGIHNLQLVSGVYVFKAGRLFYVVPDDWMPGRGADPDVVAPRLSIDVENLVAVAKASGRIDSDAAMKYSVLSFLLCVTATGEISVVDRVEGPEIPEIITLLKQARVLTPGHRGSEPIPTAVTVQLPIK